MKVTLIIFTLFLLSSTAFSHVVVFGDSIFGYMKLQKYLKERHDVDTTTYAENGARIKDILNQYTHFQSESSTDLILMNAGGNDVLKNSNCFKNNQECQRVIGFVGDTLEDMLNLMERDGVERVLLLGYYHQTMWPTKKLNPAIDAGSDMMIEVCSASAICEYIDPRVAFNNAMYNPISYDRVHPNRLGYSILTELVFERL